MSVRFDNPSTAGALLGSRFNGLSRFSLLFMSAIMILPVLLSVFLSLTSFAAPGDYMWSMVESGEVSEYGHAWTDIASSADGTRLVAVSSVSGGGVIVSDDPEEIDTTGSGIYTSADSGATWVERSIPSGAEHDWTAVASSADGVNLVAVSSINYSYSGGYYPSSNFGAFGGDSSTAGRIYTSSDSGATWVERSVPSEHDHSWTSVASSADGAKLVVVGGNHYFDDYDSDQGGYFGGYIYFY